MAKNSAKPRTKIAIAAAGVLIAEVPLYASLATGFHDPTVGGWASTFIIVAIIAIIIFFAAERWASSPKRRRNGTLFAVASGVLVLLSLVGPWRWPFLTQSSHYDGTNPAAAGCASLTAVSTLSTWTIYKTGTHTAIGSVEVIHSHSCDTDWVRARTTIKGSAVTKTITRPAGFLLPAGTPKPVSDRSLQWTFGTQVYAPNCVDVAVEITSAGTLDGKSSTHHVCA